MISLGDLIKRTTYIIDQNSTGILTGIGVVGTVSTAVLTGRASFKAAGMIEKEHFNRLGKGVERLNNDEPSGDVDELTAKEKLELVWPQFIPPVGVGTITIFSIVMANRLASKEAAALAAAYSLSERAFTEYKEKVVEKLGEGKEQSVRDEIAQGRLNDQPVNTSEVIITGNGDVLCMDALSGRYFESTMESIRQAENKINHELITRDYTSLSHFYEEIGLSPTAMSDNVGWNVNTLLELQFTTGMSTDGRPCIVVNFRNMPIADYGRLY
jgi:Family of unknown function (DUF6353)